MDVFSAGVVHLPPSGPDESPVTLKYFDSHPGRSAHDGSYTTLIALHGTGYNASIFSTFPPFLNKDVRLLAYNRRGYDGSTERYEPKEADGELAGRHIRDLLAFVDFAVKVLDVPPKDEKTRTGGIVILGWSRACVIMTGLLYVLPLLPQMENPPFHLPADLSWFHASIISHLRSVLLYEPPVYAVGFAPDDVPQLQVPMSDRGKAFGAWMSSTVPPEALPVLDQSFEEEMVEYDTGMMLATDFPGAEVIAHSVYDLVTPSVGVGLIYGMATVPICIKVAKWVEERLDGQPNAATGTMEGAGHFAMVTHPRMFATCIDELVRELDASIPWGTT